MAQNPLRIIFFGPPGAGKGTQSELLMKEFGLIHISTGDALRAEIRAETPLGKRVKSIIEAGNLVDDDTIMDIMEAKLSKFEKNQGFIFDGIPRTIGQVIKLDALLNKLNQPVTHVLYLNVDRKELKERICGRLFHPASGRVYHRSFKPPKVEMTDDATGEPLIVRKDDTEEVFDARMKQYDDTFEPVIEFYRNQGSLREIVPHGESIEAIYEKIKTLLF